MRSTTIFTAFLIAAILAMSVVAIRENVADAQQQNDRLLKHGPQQQRETRDRRIALVIGNGDYQNANRLANPINDAQDMAATLRGLGFELLGGVEHLNRTEDQMKRLISEFGEKLSDMGGIGLFYYAGHGVQSQGHNYLIPVEANILREKTLEFEAVDVNRVLREMEDAGNGFNIVILDACRTNPFTRSWRGASDGLAQMDAPQGTLIAYATSPGRVASDGTGRNGVYTAELLKQIRIPGKTVEEMFKAVRTAVKSATKNQQTPWEASSLVGNFCFAGKCNRSESENADEKTSANSADTEGPFELSYWESIKNSPDPDDYKDYLKRYPDGRFADLARRRISLRAPSNPAPPEDRPSPQSEKKSFPLQITYESGPSYCILGNFSGDYRIVSGSIEISGTLRFRLGLYCQRPGPRRLDAIYLGVGVDPETAVWSEQLRDGLVINPSGPGNYGHTRSVRFTVNGVNLTDLPKLKVIVRVDSTIVHRYGGSTQVPVYWYSKEGVFAQK